MKQTLYWMALIFCIGVGVWFFMSQRALAPVVVIGDTSAPSTTEVKQGKLSPSETANTPSQMIEVTAPLPNTPITSPITITGRARGGWYFEASFPIELRDANNVLITKTVGQAQGDWMTENFVPFTATLTFPTQPSGSQGILTFKNDNPSDEPQNSMMFDVPVQF